MLGNAGPDWRNRAAYSFQGWNDWRTDWVGSEQTLDYNIGYTMALAAAIELPTDFWGEKCSGASYILLQRHARCCMLGLSGGCWHRGVRAVLGSDLLPAQASCQSTCC